VMSCANALADSANDAPRARPMSFSDFMRDPRRAVHLVNTGQAGSIFPAIVG
jgi:hypothetical protein